MNMLFSKRFYTNIVLLLLCSISVWAQAPQKFNYQTIVRNSSNEIAVNENVTISISILKGATSGASMYSEKHTTLANSNGVVTVAIGTGSVLSGVFESIPWGEDIFFIKTLAIIEGSTTPYIQTSQLLSVPYARNVKTAETVTFEAVQNTPSTLEGYGITDALSNDYNLLDNTPTSISDLDLDAGGKPLANAEGLVVKSDIQISVSNIGDTLYLGKDQFVIIPGISNSTVSVEVPDFTNSSSSNVTSSSIVVSAELESPMEFYSETGFVWGTTPNVSIENGTKQLVGVRDFTTELEPLLPNTTYYIRAYAINENGIGYSDEIVVTTEEEIIPEILSSSESEVTDLSVTLEATIPEGAKENVAVAGFCIGESPSPIISGQSTSDVTFSADNQTYTGEFTNLTSGTNYYARAYIITFEGDVIYGDDIAFSTVEIDTEVIVKTLRVSDIGDNSFNVSGQVSKGFQYISEHGFCLSSTSNATTNEICKSILVDVTISAFEGSINNLSPATTYYAKAYAVTNNDTIYGNEIPVTTAQLEIGLTVETKEPDAVDTLWAELRGAIVSVSGIQSPTYGICWGTEEDIDLTDNITSDNQYALGQYSFKIENLEPNTTYYYRAYATNDKGTAYGEVLNFTTLDTISLADIATLYVENTTETTATPTGKILNDGGAEVSERGFCYGTSESPTIENNKLIYTLNTASQFTSTLENLTPGTDYFIRAYAINAKGTAYGNSISITTKEGDMPTAGIIEAEQLSPTSVRITASVYGDGGYANIEYGYYYGTNPDVSTTGTKVVIDNHFLYDYTHELDGLIEGETYYFNSYVTNPVGTDFGTEISFELQSGSTDDTFCEAIDDCSLVITMFGDADWVSQTAITNDGVDALESGIIGNDQETGFSFNITGAGTLSFYWKVSSEGGYDYLSASNGTTTIATLSGDKDWQLYTHDLDYGNHNIIFRYSKDGSASENDDKAWIDQIVFEPREVIAPTIEVKKISNITLTEAEFLSDITSNGGSSITNYGICFSTEPNPTVENGTFNEVGDETGMFITWADGFEMGTKYYYRAYAMNAKDTGYSVQGDFTTLAPSLPEVQAFSATDILLETATLHGQLYSTGGVDLNSYGFCYNTTGDPTTSDNVIEVSELNGEDFVASLEGLTLGTTYYFTAYATNSVGTGYGVTESFTTLSDPILPEITTSEVTDISHDTVNTGGILVSNGGGDIISQGVCWSTTVDPTLNDNVVEDQSGLDTFSVTIPGLTELTTYYARAYATNSTGTNYGESIEFSTIKYITPPTVITDSVYDINLYYVRISGRIADDGGDYISQKGFCWSKDPEPTTDDFTTYATSISGRYVGSLPNLEAGTTYYARMYAKNSKGIAYGDIIEFTTTAEQPLCEYVDFCDFTFTTSGDADWIRLTGSNAEDNIDALQSGDISNDGESILETEIEGHVELSFWWFVSSEAGEDELTFRVDGRRYGVISGSKAFTETTFYIPPGPHTLTWEYTKDYSTSEGLDAARLDMITAVPSTKVIPTVETVSHSEITETGVTLTGIFTDNGGDEAISGGFAISTAPNPTAELMTHFGVTLATEFSRTFNDLEPNTTYYIRAFVNNHVGYGYGEEISFTTLDTVSKCEAIDDCSLDLTTSGSVDWIGVTSQSYDGTDALRTGVMNDYDTAKLEMVIAGPVDLTFMQKVSSRSYDDYLTFFINGEERDRVSGEIDWVAKEYYLPPGDNTVTWIFDNDNAFTSGENAAYLDQISYVTSTKLLPEMDATSTSMLLPNSVRATGTITNDGGDAVYESGFCWSTSTKPTIKDSKMLSDSSMGTFTLDITQLEPNTTYYLRAFATNGAGTIYSNEIEFTTWQTFTDGDGAEYDYVIIGDQAWINRNLETTRFTDGTSINHSPEVFDWTTNRQPSYVAPSGNSDNTAKHGLLYNWYTVNAGTNGGKQICPNGWRVPVKADWVQLENYLIDNGYNWDGTTTDNKVARSLTDSDQWDPSSIKGAPGSSYFGVTENKTGFTAQAGGFRTRSGQYGSMWDVGTWWNNESVDRYTATRFYIHASMVNTKSDSQDYKKNGGSIRCLRQTDAEVALPSVVTVTPQFTGRTTAVASATITNDKGASITSRGFCISENLKPTLSDMVFESAIMQPEFSADISGLSDSTNYYIRAYVTTPEGTSYGNAVFIETPYNLYIGQEYQGGTIIYILQPNEPGYDPDVPHGLIAAPTDYESRITWDGGLSGIVGSTGYMLGTGATNTAQIVAALGDGNYAASICDRLVLNGYDDWFLPSYDELEKMQENDHIIGGFQSGNIGYWSSSTTSSYNAETINVIGSSDFPHNRDYEGFVRAVRKF